MRHHAFSAVAFLAAGSVFAAEGGLCTSSTGHTVSVRGSATQHLKPDCISFTVGVESRKPAVAEALKENNERVDALIAALKTKGVAAEKIRTSSFDVSTIADEKSRTRAFEVRNQVTVTCTDTPSAGALLQAALDAGGNQAGGLHFSVRDLAGPRKEGLRLAFEDARSRAQTLAMAARRQLGDVLCVSDETSGPVMPVYAGGMRAMSAEVPIESGQEEMSTSVSVVFELK